MKTATGRLARDRSFVVHVIWIAIVAVTCLAAGPSSATVVKPYTFDGLAQRAAFITEGRVTKAEARQEKGSRYIWTDVTFEILDTPEGAWPGREIRLSFLASRMSYRWPQLRGEQDTISVAELTSSTWEQLANDCRQ